MLVISILFSTTNLRDNLQVESNLPGNYRQTSPRNIMKGYSTYKPGI